MIRHQSQASAAARLARSYIYSRARVLAAHCACLLSCVRVTRSGVSSPVPIAANQALVLRLLQGTGNSTTAAAQEPTAHAGSPPGKDAVTKTRVAVPSPPPPRGPNSNPARTPQQQGQKPGKDTMMKL